MRPIVPLYNLSFSTKERRLDLHPAEYGEYILCFHLHIGQTIQFTLFIVSIAYYQFHT